MSFSLRPISIGNKSKQLLNIRIVLDRSGSMSGAESITIAALNTYLEELKKDKVKGSITLSTFDTVSIDIPITNQSIESIKAFNPEILQPRGGTPLFDAIGAAIYDLENIKNTSDDKKVLVIVTDGLENASREYSLENISKKIKEKENAGWLIIYLGADHDAIKQAKGLDFNLQRSIHYSKKDSIDAFKAVQRTTRDYHRGEKNKDISFTKKERDLSKKSQQRKEAGYQKSLIPNDDRSEDLDLKRKLNEITRKEKIHTINFIETGEMNIQFQEEE